MSNLFLLNIFLILKEDELVFLCILAVHKSCSMRLLCIFLNILIGVVFTILKFRLKLNTIGKTTRPFRYALNQILYDYTVEVTNRFQQLDLIDRVPDELWMEVCNIVQEVVIKTIPKNKKWEKAKWLSEEALQIAEKGREAKGKEEKERYIHLNAEFQRIARKEKKSFLSDQGREIEENNRMGKTTDLFKKIRDTKEIFYAKLDTIKGRIGMDLTEAEDNTKSGTNTQENYA